MSAGLPQSGSADSAFSNGGCLRNKPAVGEGGGRLAVLDDAERRTAKPFPPVRSNGEHECWINTESAKITEDKRKPFGNRKFRSLVEAGSRVALGAFTRRAT